MPQPYEFELGKAADNLIRDMLGVRKGEVVAITADTKSDQSVVNAVARSAHSVGAKPMVINIAAAQGMGKAVDPDLPLPALGVALREATVWIEFNNLLYSTAFEIARENKDQRYICLLGMDARLLVNTVGRINPQKLSEFLNEIARLTRNAKEVWIKNSSGTDLKFNNNPKNPVNCDDGNAKDPGMHMLAGQISWAPDFDSLNGKLVFDGSIDPPCGVLNDPVELIIKKGRVTEIKGGAQAVQFKEWLESFNDPEMFRLAHVSYGFNPGAELTGNILEDERVWGCTQWGLGYLSPPDAPPEGIMAKSHTDGICLDSSVWLDGELLMEKGKLIPPDLQKLEKEIMDGEE